MKMRVHAYQHFAALMVFVAFMLPADAQSQTHARFGKMVSEMPSRAQDFVDSIGVNTHFWESEYIGRNYPTVARLLLDSGIKHIRDGIVPGENPRRRVGALAASGIRVTITVNYSESLQRIESFPSMLPGVFEAFEGPNEPQLQNPGEAAKLRNFMRQFHDELKGNPATAQFPIIAPTPQGGPLDEVGDLTPYIDYGNIHDYFDMYNPGTRGWGSLTPAGVYGSLAYNLKLIKPISDDKPVMATETGWGSTPTGDVKRYALDFATQAKYVVRLYFFHHNAGIVRTYYYELLDQNKTGQKFTNFGLVDADLKPKPAYLALRAVINDLQDVHTPFTPKPLTGEISGNVKHLQHTLLQKADGTYYLALWLEVPSWANGAPVAVAPRTITLTTQSPMSSMSVMRLNDDGSATTSTLHQDASHGVALRVTDSVSIVKLTP